jgi:hypothetical protein
MGQPAPKHQFRSGGAFVINIRLDASMAAEQMVGKPECDL